jgi:hypothetical protein
MNTLADRDRVRAMARAVRTREEDLDCWQPVRTGKYTWRPTSFSIFYPTPSGTVVNTYTRL